MLRIRNLRVKKNLSGEQLGALVGVQKSAISKYERGDIQPSNEVLVAIANVLNTSTDYLLENTDDPAPPDTKEEAPAIISDAEALRIFVESKLGREATQEELNRLSDFAETFIKGLEK